MQSRPQTNERLRRRQRRPQAGQRAPRARPEAIAEARGRLKDLGFDPDKICEHVEQFCERRLADALNAAVDDLVREPR
jgi:hypothetical protein